ncbi:MULTISPECIES: hypothetical protein [Novosphingobium]|uniref:hypothetical protein n=1 Tax=Novosphingobium TaxID=165696 RepID=UPI001CD64FD2|nr:hypothetical protein [Novosphingobium percolationis]MCH7628762.1 hypothetical protein [Pseudomonadota bacterium]
MREARAFASLTSGLLARKGEARPAMRSPLQALGGDFDADDLGWNDMGEPAPVVAITPDTVPSAAPERPEVLRQLDSLANVITRKVAMDARVAAAEAHASPRPSRRKGEALKEGRKAAFTLRLDADRHLALRLAASLDNRSAQAVVLDALDAFLNDIPGMDELVRRARSS